MPDNKPPKPPPAKRNRRGIVQRDAELRSAKKATRKEPPKEVLPSPQVAAPSNNAELAAGETQFAGPMKKTVVNLKMTVQVPDAVRDLAAKTIDQAEKAFGMFFDAASKSLVSIPSPGTKISKQALSFTEQNLKAVFDHARKLVHATDIKQAMQIQTEFLKSQFTNAGQHMQQITSAIMSSAKDASKG
jgi:phasin